MIRYLVLRRRLLSCLVVLAVVAACYGASRAWTAGAAAQEGKERELAAPLEKFKGEVDLYLDSPVSTGDRGPAGRLSGVRIVGFQEFAGKKFLVVHQVHPLKRVSRDPQQLKNAKDIAWFIDPAHLVAISKSED
jgi:hypothetical protein